MNPVSQGSLSGGLYSWLFSMLACDTRGNWCRGWWKYHCFSQTLGAGGGKFIAFYHKKWYLLCEIMADSYRGQNYTTERALSFLECWFWGFSSLFSVLVLVSVTRWPFRSNTTFHSGLKGQGGVGKVFYLEDNFQLERKETSGVEVTYLPGFLESLPFPFLEIINKRY